MSVYEQTSKDLRDARVVMLKLGKTFQDFQSYCFSIIALSDQWRTLQNSFVAVNNTLEFRLKELEVKERELDMIKNKFQNFHEEVELKQKRLELRERSWSERIAMAEMKEKQVKEWCDAMELKEFGVMKRVEGVELREKEVERREGKLAEDEENLEAKRKEFDVLCNVNGRVKEQWKGLESKEKELDDLSSVLKSKEMELDKLSNELECKEKNANERVKDQWKELESKEKELDDLSNVLKSKEMELDKLSNELECKEKNANERVKDQWKELESKEKELDDLSNVLKSKEMELDKLSNELECKEKNVNERVKDQWKELESKEKELDDLSNVLKSKEMELDKLSNELECKEKNVNERVKLLVSEVEEVKEKRKGLECKEKELDEKFKEIDSKGKEFDDLSNVVKSKEKELDELYNLLECKEKNVNERVKLLVSEVEEEKEKRKGLECKEKQLDEKFKEIEAKEKELDDRSKVLKLKEKELNEGNQSVELKNEEQLKLTDKECQRQFVSSSSTQLRQELPDSTFSKVESVVDCPLSSKIGDDILSLCKSMDAEGVRIFLNEHVNEQIMLQEKILDALGCTPDPAKLVFDVSLGFLLKYRSKELAVTNKSSCIFLMEQLMKLSPTITQCVRNEAICFATFMIARLEDRGKVNLPADYYGVLQFIATFKLASYYKNSDLLLSLLRNLFIATGPDLYRYKQHIHLCRELGLLGKIPGLIQGLIARKKWIPAINFICVFKLECNFPPVPLLENRLDDLYRQINGKQKANKSKSGAERMELGNLRHLIKYITFYNLTSKRYPLDALLSRIEELENKATEDNKPSGSDAAAEQRKRNAASSCASVASQQKLEKRPRVDNVHQPPPPYGAPPPYIEPMPYHATNNTLHNVQVQPFCTQGTMTAYHDLIYGVDPRYGFPPPVRPPGISAPFYSSKHEQIHFF